MTPDEEWLAATWPLVLGDLPPAPARVVELGCGHVGGFVPELEAHGYDVTGVDPEAPEGPAYRRVEFERYDEPARVGAIVASTSLHHVADLGEVLDKARAMLAPAGVLVVVEWAIERFDEPTARWCFDRAAPTGDHPDWLTECRSEWRESGEPWDAWCRGWADDERLHTGAEMLRALDDRFVRRRMEYGPYFFPGLPDVSEADERAAIEAGLIRANRIEYVGTPR